MISGRISGSWVDSTQDSQLTNFFWTLKKLSEIKPALKSGIPFNFNFDTTLLRIYTVLRHQRPVLRNFLIMTRRCSFSSKCNVLSGLTGFGLAAAFQDRRK